MKRMSYLLVLLCCFTACKKSEEAEKIRFTTLVFKNEIKPVIGFQIKYNDKMYGESFPVPIKIGERKIEVFNRETGKVMLDTMLNVEGPQTYYVYQIDAAVPPILVTTVPEPPGEPGNPLNGVPGAPEGFMKIKIAFQPKDIFVNRSMDIVVYSVTAESSGYVPVDTLYNIGADYNTDFLLIKRPVLYDGKLSNSYKFAFIDALTKEPILNKSGNLYNTGFTTLTEGKKNLYMITFTDVKVTSSRGYLTAIFNNDLHYGLPATLLWQRQ